jgi:hypothetical protein
MQVVRIHPMLRQDREFKFKNKNLNLNMNLNLNLRTATKHATKAVCALTVRCVSTGPVVVRLAEMAT